MRLLLSLGICHSIPQADHWPPRITLQFFPPKVPTALGRTQTWGSGPIEADENPDSEVKASSMNLEVFRLNIWEEAMTHQTREYVQHQVGPEEMSVFFLGVSSETQVGLSQRPCCSSH